jgi:hypothetical protein
MYVRAPFAPDMIERARGSEFLCRVMAWIEPGRAGVVCHYWGAHAEAMRHARDMVASCGPGHWIEGQWLARLASEPVTLADGAADQSLIPGVAPVPLTARQCEQERRRREARRGHAALPCGGLWDETAINQGSLF